MTGPVSYARRGEVAVLTLNLPPVNVLAMPLRIALSACLEQASRDPAVRTVVLIGAGKVFCAGAELADFDTDGLDEPSLHATISEQIESMDKPVVAAVHGSALGGGLELALSCHYRLCTPDAKLGLPEITLGFFPGAGGTQKLPRAIGLEAALDLILSGRTVPASAWAGTALVSALAEGDLLECAVAFALEHAEARPLPRLRDRRVEHPSAQALLQLARRSAAADRRAWPGTALAIDAIEHSLADFKAGMRFEIEHFRAQAATEPARALRYGFLARTQARKLAGLAPDAAARPIKRALVIGAGLMGTGIAICFAQAGIPVTLTDRDEAGLARGRATIDSYCSAQVRRIGEAEAMALRERFAFTLDERPWREADVLVEAAFEDFDLKQALLQRMAALAHPAALIASNTSTLDLDALAAGTARPADVVGLHFFSPAQAMPLLEVVRTAHTGDAALATAMALASRLRKTPVVAGVCDGFIGNRILDAYIAQACRLVEEGAWPEQVDAALEAWGFAMGPFRMLDLVGNDVPWAARRHRRARGVAERHGIADALCEQGWFGQKTGQGWYLHAEGARRPQPAPRVHALIETFAAGRGIVRRSVAAQQIVQRCLLALINEGARVLGEGIAQRGSDIDVVYVAGYGFPAAKGGPMFQADEMGLVNVLRLLRDQAGGDAAQAGFWRPAPLIGILAASGRSLRHAQALDTQAFDTQEMAA